MEMKIPIRKLSGTDYSYIKGNMFVIFSNNVTISVDEFKKFSTDGTLVQKVERLAKIPGRLNSWDIALKKKTLQPIHLPAIIPKKTRKSKKKKIIEVEMNKENLLDRVKKWKIPRDKKQIILWIMLTTAIGSAIMSIYHASAFLYQGGKPLIISFVTGVLLVVFASTGFTASRYFWEQKGFSKIFAIPFLLITTALIVYIAFSTTSVSYGQFRDEEAGITSKVKVEISKLELYEDLQRQIKEQEKLVKSIPGWRGKNMSDETWTNYQQRKIKGEERLSELQRKAFELKNNAGGGTIAQKQTAITSVYDFINQLFGINSVLLRFIIYVTPAIFYDIVAPFGFTVVFFLLDKKEEKQELFVIKRGVAG